VDTLLRRLTRLYDDEAMKEKARRRPERRPSIIPSDLVSLDCALSIGHDGS